MAESPWIPVNSKEPAGDHRFVGFVASHLASTTAKLQVECLEYVGLPIVSKLSERLAVQSLAPETKSKLVNVIRDSKVPCIKGVMANYVGITISVLRSQLGIIKPPGQGSAEAVQQVAAADDDRAEGAAPQHGAHAAR